MSTMTKKQLKGWEVVKPIIEWAHNNGHIHVNKTREEYDAAFCKDTSYDSQEACRNNIFDIDINGIHVQQIYLWNTRFKHSDKDDLIEMRYEITIYHGDCDKYTTYSGYIYRAYQGGSYYKSLPGFNLEYSCYSIFNTKEIELKTGKFVKVKTLRNNIPKDLMAN